MCFFEKMHKNGCIRPPWLVQIQILHEIYWMSRNNCFVGVFEIVWEEKERLVKNHTTCDTQGRKLYLCYSMVTCKVLLN